LKENGAFWLDVSFRKFSVLVKGRSPCPSCWAASTGSWWWLPHNVVSVWVVGQD